MHSNGPSAHKLTALLPCSSSQHILIRALNLRSNGLLLPTGECSAITMYNSKTQTCTEMVHPLRALASKHISVESKPSGPGGTFGNVTMITSVEQCHHCPSGAYCPVGSAVATDCSAGTYSDRPGQEACFKCDAGTFQDEEGATECKPCTEGHYCTEGAAAPLPCEAGSYSNATNLTSATECTKTPHGFFSGIGSSKPEECPVGSFTRRNGSVTCSACPDGTYTNSTGSTECTLCVV